MVDAKEKINTSIKKAKRLAECIRIIMGLSHPKEGDTYADVEALLDSSALTKFWETWPPTKEHPERRFAEFITPSSYDYEKDKYKPDFVKFKEDLKYIREQNEAGTLKESHEKVDARIKDVFQVTSDVYFLLIADGGHVTHESDNIDMAREIDRRKDVLQLLVTNMAAHLRDMKDAVKESYMGPPGDKALGL